MKERGILFSSPMIGPVLDGSKTMTRRLDGLEDVNAYEGSLDGQSALGPLGYRGLCVNDYYIKPKRDYAANPGLFHWFLGASESPAEINVIPVKCPYGQIGDRLWARESWRVGSTDRNTIWYKDDSFKVLPDTAENLSGKFLGDKWRPSIHMYRWASRILLEITNVTAERLRDISEKDAKAEGVQSEWICDPANPDSAGHRYRPPFWDLWDKLNARRGYGWDVNPFVWKIEFNKLEPST